MASIRLENVTKRFGAITALDDVSLEVMDGEFFAILGPPGAGKTTTLRTIVGLERPDEGDVYLDGERVTDAWPADRDIAIVFQNLALYPDKTVYKNLAFPLRQQKVPRDEIKRRVEETARMLHIEQLLTRKPGKLSGGERQRVALGRAMVREPKAYLFDEPISALDALLRIEMRAELKRLHLELGRTLVYVTHDQVEALSMADRIAVLREGVIQQIDTPDQIYNRPQNRFVATVVGSPPMNFIPVTASWADGVLELAHETFRVKAAQTELRAQLPDGSRCWVAIRPEDVHIAADGGDGIPATVYVTEPLGGETVVDLRLAEQVIKALAAATLRLEPDQRVSVRLDPRRLHVFSDDGRALLSAAGEEIVDVERSDTAS
jgi:ABC-type sugar transport system ATPase subunit